jgi:hypothetical protein
LGRQIGHGSDGVDQIGQQISHLAVKVHIGAGQRVAAGRSLNAE